MKVKFTFEIRIVHKNNLAVMGHHIPARPGNERDANKPAVPTLNFEVNIPLKYLSNFLEIS